MFGFGATFVTVGFVYRVFPRTPLDWRSTIHGTLIAAASISLLSVTYVAYLRLGANFEHRYMSDALAAVVLLGLWPVRRQHCVAHRLPSSPPEPPLAQISRAGRPSAWSLSPARCAAQNEDERSQA